MQKILFTLAVSALICSAVSAYELARHHDYEAMKQVMLDVHQKCPDITRLYKLPPVKMEGVDIPDKTVEGRELLVIEFATNPGHHVEKKPEFKYVANMHGNEVRGRELLLKLIDYMCEMYKGNPKQDGRFSRSDILWLIENTRMHFMPSLNPDGYEKATTNTKDWLLGRENANGIDLNRNFPDLDKLEFKLQSLPEHKNNHLDIIEQVLKKYKKELQPETQMMMVWLHSENFVLSANMHDGDLVANYPLDETSDGSPHHFTPSPDQKTFVYLAESYSLAHKTMGKKHKQCSIGEDEDFLKHNGTTNGADWYSVPGGLQDYNYLSTNTMEITLELGCVKFPPADTLPGEWDQNVDALFNYMFQSHIGIKGSIIMPENVNLIATIKVTDEQNGYIDKDTTSSENGDFFRLLADGIYTVQAVVNYENSEGEWVQISRWACANVKNKPTQRNEAMIIDFDFSNLDFDEDRKPCYGDMVDYDGNAYDQQQQYYDILTLLKGLDKKYRDQY